MTHEVKNYDGGISASPRRRVWPRNVSEIQAVLSDEARFPSPVRAMGSYHSLTPCASSSGTMIDMSRMNRILAIDIENMTFTAQAGLQVIDAASVLRRYDLQLITNIEIGNMTLGAAACCHTKDGLDGTEFGQVSSYVTAVKWVKPDGTLAEASEATDPDLLHLMRSSYGLCGVVYEVTLRIEPLQAVRFSYLPRRVSDLTQQEVDRIIEGSEGLVCWTVGSTAVFQTRTRIARCGAAGALFASARRRLWNDTEARAGRFIDRYVPSGPLRNLAQDGWFAGTNLLFSTLKLVGGASLRNPDKIIDYRQTSPSAKYVFTFWAFPREQWLHTLREYLAFAEAHRKDHGFRCNMALGSYFVRQDRSSCLSYSYGGDVFSIDPIHARTDEAAWDRFLEGFNEFAHARNGIPLLNQSPLVTKRHVQAAYGRRWEDFATWVRREDPSGRMLNPFFAELL